jgi:glyoxylase-like metal-dependent hydrolase (beta-lactamase superfamily II)/rhodanese-related sulfurtransferase
VSDLGRESITQLSPTRRKPFVAGHSRNGINRGTLQTKREKGNPMRIEQIYTGCLSQAAYYLESDGVAAVIDPLRDPAPYLKRAERTGAKIRFIFETHFHADFVSGHVDLARATGATIVYGPGANPGFEAYVAKDGEVFSIGSSSVEVLHTPGHTLESSCFRVPGQEGEPDALFTGDTLFLGDVGRPDLAVSKEMKADELAALLYKSLQEKILPLADSTLLYPGHGAGSACGKKLSDATSDTLGHQKLTHYALQPMTESEFILRVLDGITPPPKYFPMNARLNREGYGPIDEVKRNGRVALSPEEFEAIANSENALVLDTRSSAEFSKAHIPRSIFIGLEGSFASWAGSLIADLKQPLLLVCAPGNEEEAVDRLSRVGLDRLLGYLEGSVEAWSASGKEIDTLENTTAEEFARRFPSGGEVQVVDVRNASEWDTGHLAGAIHAPLDRLTESMDALPQEGLLYLHCASGYRSVIGASILKSRGRHDLMNIAGGFKALSRTKLNFETSDKLERNAA